MFTHAQYTILVKICVAYTLYIVCVCVWVYYFARISPCVCVFGVKLDLCIYNIHLRERGNLYSVYYNVGV